METEVIRKTALAYFARSTAEVKQAAHKLFDAFDEDRNGRITFAEFLKIFQEMKIEKSKTLFKLIDANGDGTLDFEEFITLFFMVMSEGWVACDGCGNQLVTIYFTCLDCHVSSNDSYDLCVDCYRLGNFSHDHSVFLDSMAMLRKYKIARATTATSDSVNNSKAKASDLLKAIGIGAQLAQACTIM